MKITEMNLICLEECLEYLDLDDLLIVADSNKRLRRAADFVFNRNHSQNFFKFGSVLINCVPRLKVSHVNIIFITDLKSGLQLLRCFGHLIDHISFSYNYLLVGRHPIFRPFLEIEQRVITYVNEYCGKSIKNLELSDVKVSFFEHLKIQFTKLEELQISSSGMTEEFYNFIEKHPTLKNLNINNTQRLFARIDLSRVTKALPLLTDISIYHSDLQVDRVLHLISICKSLKTIIIYATEADSYDHGRIVHYFHKELLTRLPVDEWQTSIHKNRDPFMDLQLQLKKVHME